MPGPPLAPVASFWWMLVLHGGLAFAAGVVLLIRPDDGLAFAAVVLGVYLVLLGLLQILRAISLSDLVGMQRALLVGLGVLAVAAGAIVIARPEGTVRGVALAFGIYLIVAGLVAGVSALQNPEARALDAARSVIDLAAGITIVVWPDVTVGVVAAVFGIYLVVRGVVEVAAGLALRNVESAG